MVRPQLINVCNLLILSCSDFVLVNMAKDLSICNTNVATHHRCRLSFSREFEELPSRYFKSALVVAYLGLLIRKTYFFWEEALGWLSLIGMYHFHLKSICCGRFGRISFVVLFAWSGRHPFLIRWPDTWWDLHGLCFVFKRSLYFSSSADSITNELFFLKKLCSRCFRQVNHSVNYWRSVRFLWRDLFFFIFSRNKVATPVAVLC